MVLPNELIACYLSYLDGYEFINAMIALNNPSITLINSYQHSKIMLYADDNDIKYLQGIKKLELKNNSITETGFKYLEFCTDLNLSRETSFDENWLKYLKNIKCLSLGFIL